MATLVDSANCTWATGGPSQLQAKVQALITAGKTIIQVIETRATATYLIIHTA